MRWLRRLALLGMAVFLLTAIAVVAATLSMQQRHGEGRSLAAPVEAAIVLGGGIDPDGVPSYSSRRRVAAAVGLLRAGLAERLVMSGGATRAGGESAAELMRRHALALGTPPEAVLVEGRSATTFENLRFSFDLARRAGFDRLAIVTDDSHLIRAWLLACYFGECGIGRAAAPAFAGMEWPDLMGDITREALAWWYNVGKVALWSALDAAGMPEERRERIVR